MKILQESLIENALAYEFLLQQIPVTIMEQFDPLTEPRSSTSFAEPRAVDRFIKKLMESRGKLTMPCEYSSLFERRTDCKLTNALAELAESISPAQFARAEAIYVQSEKDRKSWQDIALRAEAERDALLAALTSLTHYALGVTEYSHLNRYRVPQIQAALKATATATGKSTFGNDWMDALDQQGDAP